MPSASEVRAVIREFEGSPVKLAEEVVRLRKIFRTEGDSANTRGKPEGEH